MAVTSGTWNWLPFGGFDFGLTEKYAPWLGTNPNQAPSIGPESGLTGTLGDMSYNPSLNQSNMTPYVPGVTAPAPTNQSSQFDWSDYQSRGWNDYDAAKKNFEETGGPQSSNQSAEELARMKWMADLESAKLQAGSLVTQGENTFQDLMGAVGNYRDRAGSLFTNAGQEISNSFNEIAGGNARLGQSARTRAMNTARAGGYGDSSRLGLMNQVTGNLAGMQGSALARRGENDASNRASLDAREAEAQTNEDSANRYLKEIRERAGDVERLGIQNAGLDFGGLLNQISNAYQTMASATPMNADSLSALTPNFGGLTNTLSSLAGGLAGQSGSTAGSGASNLSLNPASIQDLINQYYRR